MSFPTRKDKSWVMSQLNTIVEDIPDWKGKKGVERLGYAMTEPLDVALQTLDTFNRINSNNIGIQTGKPNLKGTRLLEQQAINDLISLLHGSSRSHGGYISSGGTEGNIYGQWIAREYLAANDKKPIVLVNEYTHSSNTKASKILGLEVKNLPASGGKFDTSRLVDFIKKSERPIIVVATAGYYSTGMVDDIPAINEALSEIPGKGYIHVDAAIAGYVLPFTNPEVEFDFRNTLVGSITVDGHKNGGMPYGCGTVLYSNSYQASISHFNKLAKVEDLTLIGSRPGAMAASLWATHRTLGWEGYRSMAESCLKLKEKFIRELNEYDPKAEFFTNPDMNHFGVSFSKEKESRVKNIAEKYRLVSNDMDAGSGRKSFYHFYIMPHVKDDTLKRLLSDLDHGKN